MNNQITQNNASLNGTLNQNPCPNCGYCPCCGRPRTIYYPFQQPIYYLPQVTGGGIAGGQAVS